MGTESLIKVCDNSGASYVKVINFLKKKRNINLSFGSYLKVIVCKLDKKRKQRVQLKDKLIGFIVKSRKKKFNLFAYVKFKKTSLILLTNTLKPIGTRNFGILGVSFLKKKYVTKLLSLNVRISSNIFVI